MNLAKKRVMFPHHVDGIICITEAVKIVLVPTICQLFGIFYQIVFVISHPLDDGEIRSSIYRCEGAGYYRKGAEM